MAICPWTEKFTYDVLGRITAVGKTGSSPQFSGTAAYAYDAIGQLIFFQNGDAVEAYAYDALGNRTTKTFNGILKAACQYNAINQLTSLEESSITYSYTYDKCGNLTEECRDNIPVRQYTYDTTGRMTLAKNLENGSESVYTYNALYMCIKNTRKLPTPDGFRNQEIQYVPDFLSTTNNELMAYGTDAGTIRTVFGHQYQRISQNTPSAKAFFQSDIYGSPLFATDGQGTVKQYAQRDIWGTLTPGTAILPELEENMRFTTYRYDPVAGNYFAHARFYDNTNGRMLSKDPVKRGLNQYRYCDNDPVDYTDPTGEIANILIGAGLGGAFGFGSGLVGSAISQKRNTGKINWGKAVSSGIDGAIIGATQGGLIASGAGIPTAFTANFLAGAAGSAAEQYFNHRKIDAGKSITRGLTNAVSNALYGTKPLRNLKDAFGRGFRTGAAEAGINYISDHLGKKTLSDRNRTGMGILPAITGAAITPHGLMRDPKRGCGSESPFTPKLGYHSARGYRYDVPGTGESRNQDQFSMLGFVRETVLGGLMGGLVSVAFYGAGKGIEKLKESVRGKNNNIVRRGRKIWNYSDSFDAELSNFNDGYEIRNVINKEMHLVQFHSDKQVGLGRSLKYWTTFDEANGISTIEDYMDKMALLSEWGARDHVSIAKIPAGTKIKYAIGTAKGQSDSLEFRLGG